MDSIEFIDRARRGACMPSERPGRLLVHDPSVGRKRGVISDERSGALDALQLNRDFDSSLDLVPHARDYRQHDLLATRKIVWAAAQAAGNSTTQENARSISEPTTDAVELKHHAKVLPVVEPLTSEKRSDKSFRVKFRSGHSSNIYVVDTSRERFMTINSFEHKLAH
jgi:hypothetical protein